MLYFSLDYNFLVTVGSSCEYFFWDIRKILASSYDTLLVFRFVDTFCAFKIVFYLYCYWREIYSSKREGKHTIFRKFDQCCAGA